MRTGIFIVLSIFATVFLVDAASRGTAADKDEKGEKKGPIKVDKDVLKKLMTRKLDASQRLLKALVMNKLDDASAEAEELKKVRKDAAWLIKLKGKEEEYEMWSKDFTRSADKIIKAAQDRNVDAAKMGYLELTHSCFGCHTYVRDYGDISHQNESH